MRVYLDKHVIKVGVQEYVHVYLVIRIRVGLRKCEYIYIIISLMTPKYQSINQSNTVQKMIHYTKQSDHITITRSLHFFHLSSNYSFLPTQNK